MIDILVDNISRDIINYNNIDNYNLNEVFNIICSRYDIRNIDINRLMVKVVSCVSKYGYDIITTHPFKLSKYK